MDLFSPTKHGNKTQRKRGVVCIRCTGKHAKLIEAKVKNFMLRFDDPQPAPFEPGKFLTIIKYEGRFQNQVTIAKNEVLLKSVVPFYLDKDGMTVGQTKRVLTEKERHELINMLKGEAIDYIYVVDSYGSLFPYQIEEIISPLVAIPDIEVGFHPHNSLQMAFANSLEAIRCGAHMIDSTIYGMGRAAGNCPLELILGFLKNPKFDIRPVRDLISKDFIPLREKIEWGYIIPYAITGILDEHPRAAMALRSSNKKENYREFYEELIGGDEE